MSLNRNIFKHTAIYSFASILGKAIGFLMLPFYAHILRSGGYGVIGLIEASLGFLQCFLGISIVGAIIRYYHEKEGREKLKVISTAIILVWCVGIGLAVIGMLISPQVSKILFEKSDYYLLICLALISLVFDMAGRAACSILIIEQRSIVIAAIELVKLFIGLSLNIYLIVVLGLGIKGYFLSSAISATISSFIFHFIALRKCGITFDRQIAKMLISFEAPLMISHIVSLVSNQIERVLVRFSISIESVGILEMGYKLSSLIMLLIIVPFNQSWGTKRIEIAGNEGAPEEIGRMFTWFFFLITFASLLMSVNAKSIIEILTPEEFWLSYRIVRLEVISMILTGCYYHLFFGLYYEKRAGQISLIRITTYIIKLPLSYLFIKTWGILGAAYSGCIAAAVLLIWSAKKAQSLYPIRIEYKKLIATAFLAICIYYVLTTVDITSKVPLINALSAILTKQLTLIASTPLGYWKSGIIANILLDRGDEILELFINTILCLPFLALFPFIKGHTLRRP